MIGPTAKPYLRIEMWGTAEPDKMLRRFVLRGREMQSRKKNASRVVLIVVILALAGGTTGLFAQDVDATPVIGTPSSDKSWPDVHLNVVVLGKPGLYPKIDEGEFLLFEDGSKRQVQLKARPDSPVSLAIMIDSSGSSFKYKDAIISAVKSIVKGIPHGSEVMIIDFNSVAYLDVPFTDVSKVDLSLLDRLSTNGGTAIYDALMATETYVVTQAKYPRRALVLLSDGIDNASHATRGNAVWKMMQPGAPVVYLCATSKANIFQQDLMVGHINMINLAKWVGGIELKLNPDAEAAGAEIADIIRHQYALQFTAANTARDGKRRKLAVMLSAKDEQIYALPSYFAPAK